MSRRGRLNSTLIVSLKEAQGGGVTLEEDEWGGKADVHH